MTIATGYYATAPRSGLTVVQTSVGTPKWLVPLPQLEAAKPTGIYDQGLEWPEFSERYLKRLSQRWDKVERDLHVLLHDHHEIALCCWCREPRTCHRRLLADVIEQHGFGPVPEVIPGAVRGPTGGKTEPAHNPQPPLWAPSPRRSA